MVRFKEDILWVPNQPITVDLFNFMSFNDVFIDNHCLESKVANVANDGSLRDSPRWIVNHASLFARKVPVNPTWNSDEDDWLYHQGTYNFPGNGYWDPQYQPIVICTPTGHRGLPQSIITNTIRDEFFTYTWYILEDVAPPTGTFYMDVLALGIKPVEENDLDTDGDPSP